MKTVQYMGQPFQVPDEANYIAADASGAVYAYTHEPLWGGDRYWSRDDNCLAWLVGDVDIKIPPLVKI